MTGAGAPLTETSGADGSAGPGLDALRAEIDRIDASLHALLMERGEIIDRLIAVKARAGGGSAFRPAREASMMRRLVERHRGILPLATVEGIWRIIISTFTFVQAPYAVHAEATGAPEDGDAAVRDACRFHFGFTVPLETHGSAAAVIAAVARAQGDLGLIRCASDGAGRPWWDALRAPGAPKVIARLPFIERADHAAGLPLFVIAKPLAEAAPQAVRLYAVDVPDGPAGPAASPLPFPVTLVDRVATAAGASLLLSAPGTLAAAAVAAGLPGAPEPVPVGSHAARYEVEPPPTPAGRPPAEALARMTARP